MKNQHPRIKLIGLLAAAILALACFVLSPQALAVCQEGCLTNENTVLGDDALINITTGAQNTAIGSNALVSNTTASGNTAVGANALFSNRADSVFIGNNNTATGANALFSNTTGGDNTATGAGALFSNTTAPGNTADGANALQNNISGYNNTAVGTQALQSNTTGVDNLAVGARALQFNTTGSFNTALGDVLSSNTTGLGNTAIGVSALTSNTTGNYNVAIGSAAGSKLTTGSNNIDIGNSGLKRESNTIRIGTRQTHQATFIAGISGATVPTGVAVVVDATGHLGTITSSGSLKEAIKPMNSASEAILALQPVTFRYRHELDSDGIPQFGLIAEQVEKVNPDLVARDEQGKPYTVRYEAVNAMLLNEFLKAHRRLGEQEETIIALKAALAAQGDAARNAYGAQQREIDGLRTAVKDQAAQIRKVSDQLAASQSAPPMLASGR